MPGPYVVACLPAFNEENHIASVLVHVRRIVDLVIVCDDGSSDLTGDIAEAMGAVVIRHERNLGYGAAIQSLLKAALAHNADIAVTLDSDEQHDPVELTRLVKLLWGSDYDILIGSRFTEGGNDHVPGWRKAGIDVINRLSTNGKLSDSQSGFRAYHRKALEALVLTENGMGVSTEILLKAHEAKLKIGEAAITVKYLEDSSTHHPVAHGFDVVFSTIKHLTRRRPLLFFGVPGFFSLMFSFILWAFIYRLYTSKNYFSTNLAFISLTATLVGVILLTSGLIIWIMVSYIRDRKI